VAVADNHTQQQQDFRLLVGPPVCGYHCRQRCDTADNTLQQKELIGNHSTAGFNKTGYYRTSIQESQFTKANDRSSKG
jgi:hypothetical protein